MRSTLLSPLLLSCMLSCTSDRACTRINTETGMYSNAKMFLFNIML